MAYSDADDLNEVWGTGNVTAWATLADGDSAGTIAARKTRSITMADAMIDAVARTAGYRIPMQTIEGGTTPTLVNNLSAVLAGVWMYEAFGAKDFDPKSGAPYHRLTFRKMESEKLLDAIRVGQLDIDAVRGN